MRLLFYPFVLLFNIMKKNYAKYFVRINSNEIDKSDICGTKNQITILINLIKDLKKNCSWYLFDIRTYPEGWLEISKNTEPIYFYNSKDLKSKLEDKYQFTFGIFICIESNKKIEKWTRIFDSEENLIPDLEYGFLEIRPFDGSYYEIYSNDFAEVWRIN